MKLVVIVTIAYLSYYSRVKHINSGADPGGIRPP